LLIADSHQAYASLGKAVFPSLIRFPHLSASVLRTVNFNTQTDFTNVKIKDEVPLSAAELPLGLHLTLLGKSLTEDSPQSIFRRGWAASHLSREP